MLRQHFGGVCRITTLHLNRLSSTWLLAGWQIPFWELASNSRCVETQLMVSGPLQERVQERLGFYQAQGCHLLLTLSSPQTARDFKLLGTLFSREKMGKKEWSVESQLLFPNGKHENIYLESVA